MQSNSPAARLVGFHRAHGITAAPRPAVPAVVASAQRRPRRQDVSLEPGGVAFLILLLLTTLLAAWASTDLDALTIGSAPSSQQVVR